jgi:uncharacterized cupin superfamily protein
VKEASSENTPFGRYITSEGWFVLNLGEALAARNEKAGAVYPLEAREAPFGDFGVNVRVLGPGEPNALYHSETGQEGFLVLWGECTLIVQDEERTLRQWDYFHCPPETGHIMIGGSEQPCVLFTFGNRLEGAETRYEVEPAAAKHDASVATATGSSLEAYGPREFSPAPSPWPPA